jgi:hypothetical protein
VKDLSPDATAIFIQGEGVLFLFWFFFSFTSVQTFLI